MNDSELQRLLKEHDECEARLRVLKRELGKAAADYGVRRGLWGFSPDHLRRELNRSAA